MMDQNNSTIRTYMAIMAERDAAILERNLAIDERKRALAERDMAMLQRDAAISERNSAIHERNEAIATLQLRGPTTTAEEENMVTDPTPEPANPRKVRLSDDSKPKRASKLPRVVKTEEESLDWLDDWGDEDFVDPSDEEEPDKHTWDDQGLGLDHDVSAMPVPVCSCTGTPQPCYKWGNGGWQSACCTTTISMYPLPQASHKRYSRVGGRKMSGAAFAKLLSRLDAEGYDLSAPLDLKDHWAKHGTNRYSTSK